MTNQKIAIITACYNVPVNLLHEHFTSVRNQFRDDILHVVVDDCSTNADTRSTLLYRCDAQKHNTVLIAKKENSGPGATRNRAIEFLKKRNDIKYVCLLDADDYLEDSSLTLRRSVLDNSNHIAVYGDKYTAKWKQEKDIISQEYELSEVEKTLEQVSTYDKPRLHRECYIPSCSVMFRWKPFIDMIGEFKEDVRLCEDWLVWRKLSLLGSFHKINVPIYTQTLHGNNLTTNPEVLKNHLDDMMTTRADLDNWMNQNIDKIVP